MNRPKLYNPPFSQFPADILRVDTCDTLRSMHPRPRIRPACATVRGHRAAVFPGHGGRGKTLPYRLWYPLEQVFGTESAQTLPAVPPLCITHWSSVEVPPPIFSLFNTVCGAPFHETRERRAEPPSRQ